MSKTLAVIVGVSKYGSALFPRLPSASADARRVAQSLLSWGIRSENVLLLIDEDATRKAILRALRVWPLQKASTNIRLIFYYAGHASRIQDSDRPASSVLLPYDTEPEDRLSTGISLAEVTGALSRIKPVESHLFFDACSLRIDQLENVLPSSLPDAELLKTAGTRSLFCMVAAGLGSAYENPSLGSGFFTQSLLSNTAELRQTNRPTSSALAQRIETELIGKGLPPPQSYAVGSPGGWPLPDPAEEDPSENTVRSTDVVPRASLVAHLQDLIVTKKGLPVWIWGESGLGKTLLVQMLAERSPTSVYSTAPIGSHEMSINIANLVAADIADQLPVLFASGRPMAGLAENTFTRLSEELPGSLVVVDHMERLASEQIAMLVTALANQSFDVVLVARTPPHEKLNVFVSAFPPLSNQEVEKFRETFNPTSDFTTSLLQTVTRGNPLMLRQFLSSPQFRSRKDFGEFLKSKHLDRAAAAVSICGGYADEHLFRDTYELTITDLSELERLGLIAFTEDGYVAHDSLSEILSSTDRDKHAIDPLRYWSEQMLETPQSLWTCRKLIESFFSQPLKEHEDYHDTALRVALESLVRIRDWQSVEDVAKKIVDTCSIPSEAALYAIEELTHLSKHRVVDYLITKLKPVGLPPSQAARLLLAESERHFWYGDYDKSINIAERVLGMEGANDYAPIANLNVAIAHFFKGEWHKSTDRLIELNDEDNVDTRTLGWSRMILGTIQGLRGTDIKEGRKLLQSSIRLLTQIGDEVGAAISWNNLGEMSWKLKEYRDALNQLSTGYELAVVVGDKPNQLETTRNLIHVRLRVNGPDSPEVRELLERVDELMKTIADPTEQMQVWNTLATVAAYGGNQEELRFLIEKASTFTEDNAEYHIYTLANRALLEGLRGNYDSSIKYLDDALMLALNGENYLAMEQISNDVRSVFDKYSRTIMDQSMKYISEFIALHEVILPYKEKMEI